MKATELRIGNSIRIDGIIVKVDQRTIFDFYHDSRKKEGVLITSEIIKQHGGVSAKNYNAESYIIGEYLISSLNEKWFISNSRLGVKISICKYLHQLQNLYFALTGEELQIKER